MSLLDRASAPFLVVLLLVSVACGWAVALISSAGIFHLAFSAGVVGLSWLAFQKLLLPINTGSLFLDAQAERYLTVFAIEGLLTFSVGMIAGLAYGKIWRRSHPETQIIHHDFAEIDSSTKRFFDQWRKLPPHVQEQFSQYLLAAPVARDASRSSVGASSSAWYLAQKSSDDANQETDCRAEEFATVSPPNWELPELPPVPAADHAVAEIIKKLRS